MGQRLLRAQKRAARIDFIHEIIGFHFGIQRTRHGNRTGIIHQPVQPAKGGDGLGDGFFDLFFFADITLQGERLAPRFFDLLGDAKNRAVQIRTGCGSFGGDGNIRAALCQFQGNRTAYPAAAPRYKECFA